MVKKVVLIAVAVLLVGAAFFCGTWWANRSGSPTNNRGAFAGGPGGNGGPMANLSAEEQAKVQNMTEAERQQFFQEKMGSSAPDGAAGGPRRGGQLEGQVIEVSGDTITLKLSSGSSQTVYTDTSTVTAYVEGAAKLASGSNVIVYSQQTAENVNTASVIVVKK